MSVACQVERPSWIVQAPPQMDGAGQRAARFIIGLEPYLKEWSEPVLIRLNKRVATWSFAVWGCRLSVRLQPLFDDGKIR